MEKLNILIATPVGRTDKGEYIDYFPSRWSGSSGLYKVVSFFPYNLAYLTSYMKMKTNHSVKMVDPNYYGVDTEEYIDIIKKNSPDVFIVEIDAIIEEKMLSILKDLKKINPKLKIITCGPSPTADPEKFLVACDFVAIGEFETSITNLTLNGFSNETLGIYPNKREALINLDLLPFPENNDIKRRDYCRHYGSEYNEVEIYSTRGCPHMCNFCVIANVYASKPSFRVRNAYSVIEEIKYLKSTIPDLEGLFFNEDSHTSNRSFIVELLNEIIKNDLNDLKYNCMTNYDTLDYELLKLMKDAGYYKIRIGIETLDESVSKFITKTKIKSSHSKLFEILNYCKELGIKIYATMSIGVKNSSLEKDLLSLEQLKLLYEEGYIQEFSVSINTPMPGTPFYKESVEENWIVKNKLFDGSRNTTIEYPNYTASDIEFVYEKATELRMYINKNNIEKRNINYSMYDRQWCKPVYDITKRKIGEKNLRVGICVPNYNMGSYLPLSIESALNQTYDNCTIYILDNNSQDNSWEIINEYKRKYKNIKIFRNDYTISMEENWNKVLRLAKDEDFVNILSSDDQLKPTYVRKCLNIFEKYKDLGYVYSDRDNVQNNQTLESTSFYDSSGVINKNEEFIINIKGFHTAPCQLLIRNEALKEVGYLSTQFGIVSDMHLTLKLNAHFDIGYLNEKLVCYNITSGMSTNFENIKLMAIQFHRLKRDILKNFLPLELKSDFEYLNKSVDSFCAKFCISKLRQFIKNGLYEEAKDIFLLSAFFEISSINELIYSYMVNNIKYNLEEFDRLYSNESPAIIMPYSLPKNSIIFKG